MKNFKSKKGFTLIETIFSILILAIVIMGGMRMYFASDEFMTYVVHKKIAIEIANSELEDIRRQGYSALPDPTSYVDFVSWYTADTTIGDLPALTSNGVGIEALVKDYDDPVGEGFATDYKEVQVIVSWKEANQNQVRQVQFATFIAR